MARKANKFINILKMISKLNKNGEMTTKKLAEELNLNRDYVRKVLREIDLDEEIPIWIESRQGVGGGVKLQANDFWKKMNLSNKEVELLEINKKYLESGIGYPYVNEYSDILEKIEVALDSKNSINYNDDLIFKGYNEMTNEEVEYYKILQEAISKKIKVKMTAFTISSKKVSERMIHPYKIVSYKGINYFIAYCEKNREPRDFKLSRVRKLELMAEYFQNDDFDLEEHMKNCFGMYKGDKSYKVKLKIRYPHSEYIKETLKNPETTITEIDEDTVLFEAEMRGKPEIITWIQSMGSYAEVLEPVEFREDILEEIKKIEKKYLK